MFTQRKPQEKSDFKEKCFVFMASGTAGPSGKEAVPKKMEPEIKLSPTEDFRERIENPENTETTINNLQLAKDKNLIDASLYVNVFKPFAEKLSGKNTKLNELIAVNLIESFKENITEEARTELDSGDIKSFKLKNEGRNLTCEINGTSFQFPFESEKFTKLEEERNEILNNQSIARQEDQDAIAEDLLFA